MRNIFFVASIVGSMFVTACGSAVGGRDSLAPEDGSVNEDGGLTLDGTPGEDGGISVGCKPPCNDATEICSVKNVCIPKGTCADDGDCGAGMKCDLATKKCVPGGGCGAEEAKADEVPPNMLIVLDRSCSMRGLVSGTTKWELAVKAINAMTTKFTSKIRFGLTLFPDTTGDRCLQDAIPISPGPGNEPKIQTLLTNALKTTDANYPDGPCVTNIDTAMQQAQGAPELKDKTRSNYVLLVSDGAQAGCGAAGGDPGTEKIIGDLFKAGVKTAVIGFGAGVDGAQLDKFAVAGGMPATGATKYYKAEDGASLDKALSTIASSVLGCTFKLGKTPPDATKIYVFFDDTKEVARDKTNGWEYDPATNTVTFYGTSCADLQAGKVKDVDIVFGCRNPTPS